MIQLTAVTASVDIRFVVTFILAKVMDSTMGLRIRDEEEPVGLDISQHAERAYTRGEQNEEN